MSVKDGISITVLNLNNFTVTLRTNIRSYTLQAAKENTPTMADLSFAEIEYVNSRSNVFRNGTLRFRQECEREIYEALSVFEYESILSNAEIQNIILNPSIDGLKRIIAIKDESVFLRVRGILTALKNTNMYDISHRVIQVIDARNEEFRRNIFNSKIEIRAKDTVANVNENEFAAIKEQNDILKKQLAKMEEMVSKILSAESGEPAPNVVKRTRAKANQAEA